jgi:2-(1,2-epoxy-1,2-dihydrophenyl)acetyl-CoA isomerase
MSTVNYEISNHVAYITLNRPEKYNSVNRELAMALQESLASAAGDDAVRCVYITGSGKGFCAGQDLAEASDPATLDFERLVKEIYNPVILAMRQMDKPVVVAVNGVAAGAGANLALAGDIVLARQSAVFVQAFVNIGLIPDSGGTFMLPRLVGMQRAMALTMTGDKVSADEAAAMGMIYKSIPDERFEAESRAFAEKLAQMPTTGIALTKQLMNASFSNTLEQQLEQEAQLQVSAGRTHDFVEGVTAFLEKRKPVFKGK